ncbi:MAG: PIG-L family deacetylase [Thermomicrobiales bacterium]|nr:PIG-L family deacetylase [Thermomicrobiales bacterium]
MRPEPFSNDYQRYMIVVAHPDDSEFGAAGTVARLTAAGKQVTIVQVTSGAQSIPYPDANPHRVAAVREGELREAARRLGVREVVFLRYPDGEVKPDLGLREKLMELIQLHQPDVVITHDPVRPYALGHGHRAVGLAASDAVHPAAHNPLYFPEHLREGLAPHKTTEIWCFGAEHPDVETPQRPIRCDNERWHSMGRWLRRAELPDAGAYEGTMTPEPFSNDFQRYMIVVAHPDDSEFGAAGTVARLTAAGKQVTIVQVTSGGKGSPNPDANSNQVAATRESELREAARRLGVQEVVFLRCTDGELTPDLNLREKIVRMIRAHKPDVIVTHDPFRPYALHADHRAVGLVTTDAVYPTARDPLYFPGQLREGLEPHKTAEIWYFGAERPDKVIDITDTFDRKIDALMAHKSQIGDAEGLDERMRERAREVAEGCDFELGEAFKVVQMRR